ncbi:pentatricopeptide repeat-containing protein At1g11710, mitochondrial isoform X4 [Cannabis sativa]|uniref:pentatricopeptide repeat-containing protein At1g11710, mitochondrial isoform X4 n=1 Tax=Cannabis sativa TaxID=3483 RepID=UPI0029CA48B7|nr:pentatricopeptide repeat-containing protein At1g11710, mitochondrial isoform X4 [Cannabis sativa]
MSFCVPRTSFQLLRRGFHLGKQFKNPTATAEDIVFRAICVNVKQKKWKFLEQITPSLTDSLVSRVLREFQNSPKLALEFYNRIGESKTISQLSLESSCTLVHVFVNSRRYDNALNLMGSLMSSYVVSPLEILEGLVKSYEACGSCPAVFDALVRACTQFGATEGAYEVMEKLRLDGVWVTIHAWNNFLSHLLKLNETFRFWNMYKEMVSFGMLKIGIWPNIVTFNMIMDGACKIGDLELALKLFKKMGVMSEGDMEGASLLFSDMVEKHICPDKFTYSILINGFCRKGNVNEALKLHKLVLDKKIIEDLVSYNILINHMCKTKNFGAAKQLLGSMFVSGLPPDLITYGTFIDGHCKEGNIESAVQVYEKMIKVDKKPNLVIYNSVMNGLCKEASSVDIAELLFDELRRIGSFNATTFNTLINGFCIMGNFNAAFDLVSEMRKVGVSINEVTFNTLVNLLCKFGCFQHAKELMKVMILHGVVPDFITYTTLITNFSKNCSSEEVIELHDYMVIKGVIPDKRTYKAMVCPLLQEEKAKNSSAE